MISCWFIFDSLSTSGNKNNSAVVPTQPTVRATQQPAVSKTVTQLQCANWSEQQVTDWIKRINLQKYVKWWVQRPVKSHATIGCHYIRVSKRKLFTSSQILFQNLWLFRELPPCCISLHLPLGVALSLCMQWQFCHDAEIIKSPQSLSCRQSDEALQYSM